MYRSEKRCYRCTLTKPRTDFYLSASKLDGLRDECKTCSADLAREYYARHAETLRAKARVRMAALRASRHDQAVAST